MERHHRGKVLISIGVLLAVLGYGTHAGANCAAPVTYEISVDGNTVTITPVNESHRGCPATDGLLRQNVTSGEIVRVPDVCGPEPEYDYENRSFVDECVPAGRYRYGFAEPYTCVSYACGTYFFEEATVATPLADCQRDHPDDVPSAVSSVPWEKRSEICPYAGDDDDDDDQSSGCTALPRGGRTVLLVDLGLGMIAGLALIARRRRNPRS